MAGKKRVKLGTIAWVDLTVKNAEVVRDFYAAVAGWKPEAVSMGRYSDYNMIDLETGRSVAGICHQLGGNKDLPAQWLIYVVVADLDASLAECTARGGAVVTGPKIMGPKSRFAVIRDPAGAVAALFEQK